LFGDHFYFAATNLEDVQTARSAGFRPVVALPAHYGASQDRWKWEIVQSIRTRTLLRQEHPAKQLTGDFHFRSPAEMTALFRDCPEPLTNTLELAERCTFELPLGAPQFPAFAPPDGSTPHAFLRQLVLEGLRRRYPGRAERLRPQIEEELAIIAEVGYEEYFLVVWDLLQECRRHGIDWITRGSAADSLVCYCLGISDVCPIRFDLYFRRFLNKERMQMNKLPDIDIDFAHDRKDDVIDLFFEKYGARHAAVVGGFSTFQARSAVADVAKVLGVSEFQIRRFTEHFPWTSAGHIREAVLQSQECRDLPVHEEPYRTALEMAAFLDGFPRYPKMHPCGVVLSRQPMAELTPTFTSNKGYPTTHFDMDAVEAIGLVKIDILAQGGLAAMRDTRSALAARGIEVDVGRLEPWDDPQVWEMIAGGGARAVHHIESPAMVGLCRQCNVRDIDGLVAIVSVIRPGAANEQKKLRFTRRYQGLEPITYPHPSLEPCLKSTFGLVVYEEHILQICEAFAGLPPGRADVLRRALGKLKQELIDEIQGEFFACARARGHPEELIGEVWNLVRGFAGYAFCKAHSTAYGVEAYQSAWLKRYYPVEFMAAVLSNGKGFYHPLVYILECHRLGLSLLPPSVNQPGPMFAVEQQAIRVPLTRLKGLTEQTRERLVLERRHGAFASLSDFYRRVAPAPEEMEAMIRVGALDEFGRTRTAQFWEAQHLHRAFGDHTASGQGWLLPPPALDRRPALPLIEPTRRQRLEWETELLDFAVSGHPLALYDDIAWDTYCPVARLGEHLGEQVVTCGLVIEQRTHHQVTGEPMKFLTLADWTGMVETELFAATYRSYGLATVRYPVLEVTATVEPFENGRGFSLRVLRAGKPRKKERGTL
jgi:DNA-directed DNA polymerase III PolC